MPYLSNLPCVVLDNIEDLDDKDKYKNFLTNNETVSFDSFFVEWWIEKIRSNEIKSMSSTVIKISSLQIKLFLLQNLFKNKNTIFRKNYCYILYKVCKKSERVVY